MFVIPRGVLESHRIAATEKTRFAMNGIRLERRADGKANAQATDGKRMISVTWSDESDRSDFPEVGLKTDPSPGFVTILPQSVIEKALKVMPRKAPKPILERLAVEEEAGAGGEIKVASTDLAERTVFESRAVEGSFPDTSSVWPKGRPVAHTCFNPVYLVELAKAMVEAQGQSWRESCAVRCEFYDAEGTSAIRVSVRANNGIETVGLLMPINTGGWEGYEPVQDPSKEIEDLHKEVARLKSKNAQEVTKLEERIRTITTSHQATLEAVQKKAEIEKARAEEWREKAIEAEQRVAQATEALHAKTQAVDALDAFERLEAELHAAVTPAPPPPPPLLVQPATIQTEAA